MPVRKPGKLPADTLQAIYDKEYGKDTIEIHRDAITPDDVVVLTVSGRGDKDLATYLSHKDEIDYDSI